MVFFGDAAGDASVEADAFFVVDFLLVVDAAWVVAPVDVIEVSSFFWDWQPRKAASVSAVIKDKTGVFIELVKLTKIENVETRPLEQALKSPVFSFQICNFSFVIYP